MAEITISQLTSGSVEGDGLFDVLMRATKAHLEQEFAKGRIKGAEYATVYLGSLQAVLERALTLLLQQQRVDLEAQLLAAQIITEGKNQALLDAQLEQVQAQTAQIISQTAIAQAQSEKDLLVKDEQIANLTADTALKNEQKIKLQAETLLVAQQQSNLQEEALNIPKQGAVLDAQAAQIQAEKLLTEQRKLNLVSEALKTDAEKLLTDQRTANAVTENAVLLAQECKLRAEYDVLLEQKVKTVAESALLAQKKLTEQAQILGTGVDTDSIIGRQKALYQAQAEGFIRNAEQKAAQILTQAWQVQRTTDVGIQANPTNRLDDAHVGQAIARLLEGVGAPLPTYPPPPENA